MARHASNVLVRGAENKAILMITASKKGFLLKIPVGPLDVSKAKRNFVNEAGAFPELHFT